ncbi:MAG: hypothetical protein QW734_03755 [Candidatus Bathyarchaeia archaeon]
MKEIKISDELISKLKEVTTMNKQQIDECLKDVNKCLAEIKEKIEKLEKSSEKKPENVEERKVRVSVKDFIEHLKRCPDCQEVVKSIIFKEEKKEEIPKEDHKVETYFKLF